MKFYIIFIISLSTKRRYRLFQMFRFVHYVNYTRKCKEKYFYIFKFKPGWIIIVYAIVRELPSIGLTVDTKFETTKRAKASVNRMSVECKIVRFQRIHCFSKRTLCSRMRR